MKSTVSDAMTVTPLSRRALLFAPRRSAPQRPPWHQPEALFVERCGRCNACIEQCPERILTRADGGFPAVDFNHGECTFCGACVTACPSAALERTVARATPWSLTANVNDRCLTAQNVLCTLCREQCEAQAISLDYRAGQVAKPRIEPSLCTGCGACYAVCPTKAIALAELSEQECGKNV